MLLIVPLLMTRVLGCKSIDEIQNELKNSGQPVITSIVPNSAKFGQTVTLRGVNFETATGRVAFQDANKNVAVAEIVGWAEDFVVVKVPSLAGSPTESQVHMVTAGGKVLTVNPTLALVY